MQTSDNLRSQILRHGGTPVGANLFCRLALITCFSIIPACEESYMFQNGQSGFGIYLTRGEVPPSQLEALPYVAPADNPLISIDDIISYTWSSHVIRLTDHGTHILDTLAVPVRGRSFVVCVDEVPKYHGAFWTPISSLSFVGTTIIFPNPTPGSIRIGRGYPADSDTSKPDPRVNTDVETALRKAGKLL